MTTSATEIARLSSMTASERVAEINARTREWVEAEEGRWAMYLVEEPEFWAKMGIVTGLDLARDLLAETISDFYKEVHGIRPRWYDFDTMTLEEMEAIYDRLSAEAAAEREREREWERECEAAEAAWLEAEEHAEEDRWYEVQDRLSGF